MAMAPNSGPTVASRTTMYVGKTLQEACQVLAEKIIKKADFRFLIYRKSSRLMAMTAIPATIP